MYHTCKRPSLPAQPVMPNSFLYQDMDYTWTEDSDGPSNYAAMAGNNLGYNMINPDVTGLAYRLVKLLPGQFLKVSGAVGFE